MKDYQQDDRGPTPELLAAYADGELDPATREQVEAWLAARPDLRAEVEDQRRLTGLCQDTAPADPPPDAWEAVLAGVEASLSAPAAPPARRRPLAWAAAVALAAAAVLLAVLLPDPRVPQAPAPGWAPAEPEALPVLASDEVEVLTIHAADVPLLVVGEPPFPDYLVLADATDIVLERIEGDLDGNVPDMRFDGSGPPMLVAPPPDEPPK